jgi:glycosyltransferase involved in cell wall biosynthesis
MHERSPFSAVVMTRNEERNVAACLRSLDRAGEVFVVDSGSDDATCAIARGAGAHVVPFSWNGRYPKKKQWCLENLPFRHDWVLYLDADERVTPELAEEIATVTANPAAAAYFISLDYVFLGKRLRHGHRVVKLALVDRTRVGFPPRNDLGIGNAGEVELHLQPVVDGPTAALRHRIVHNDHDALFHWFERHNRYSDWEAGLRRTGELPVRGEAQPRGRGLLKRTFARLPGKGLASFVYGYVLRLGFLDGRAGFHYALARAFYYWQVGLKQRELDATPGGDVAAVETRRAS